LDVSALNFLNDTGKDRLRFPKIEDGYYLELTSIEHRSSGFAHVELHSGSEEFYVNHGYGSQPNGAIEVWDSWLFLEVGRICVDDVMFNARGETIKDAVLGVARYNQPFHMRCPLAKSHSFEPTTVADATGPQTATIQRRQGSD
jgi:hypothetical protein